MSVTNVNLHFVILLPLLCCFLDCEGCMEDERAALLQIKNSINSPQGNAFSSWYGEADCCRWEGVECNVSTSRVVKIFFGYSRMEQTGYDKPWYPNATWFAQFKDLQELRLQGNHIGGFISPNALQELKHLQWLELHDNNFKNSSHLCWENMNALYHLDLSKNELNGHIPKCICGRGSLTDLNLSENLLEGDIDGCLSNMTSLEHLSLSDNRFGGKFPSMLFRNLTNIQSFHISNNYFKDVISLSIFANLSKLSSLYISPSIDNYYLETEGKLEIETEIPSWIPSFSLNELTLRGCNLNMHSGNHLPSFLSTQHHLHSLDLSYNLLVGSIPPWFFYNISSELRIGGNNFSGLFPRSQRNMSSQLAILDISNNNLRGPIEDVDLIFPELRSLLASRNMFNGTFPDSISEVKQLWMLDLSENFLQGEIPRNMSLPNLEHLGLYRNDFLGSLPNTLPYFLRLLDVRDNGLSMFPENFTVPPLLRSLLVSRNSIEGQIPSQLCEMKYLQFLDLSHNYLSGDIPACLDNITHWTEFTAINERLPYLYMSPTRGLDISENQLTGTIPEFTQLRAIQIINMSHNLLTGQIPPSLRHLGSLEVLDLSHNKLFGELPSQLTELIFLAVFNVSFNNLSGPIPVKDQFATFDDYSYRGNINLCGPPLAKECNHLSSTKHGEEEKNNTEAEMTANSSKLCPNKAAISTLIACHSILFLLIQTLY